MCIFEALKNTPLPGCIDFVLINILILFYSMIISLIVSPSFEKKQTIPS